jgi:hypothetical protein
MTDKKIYFNRTTIDPDCFKLENVLEDNACFYRAIANGIMSKSSYKTKENDFINQQTLLSKELQMAAYEWLTDNKDCMINKQNELGDSLKICVKDLIQIVHDISYEQYVFLYKHFAGDYIVSNQNNEMVCLHNRWGSYVEQLALSNKLKLPIIVFILQKYDDKNNKIILGRIFNGRTIYKNTRLKVCQITGIEYLNSTNAIFLLWKKSKDCDHYMSLYPINDSIENELIKSLG